MKREFLKELGLEDDVISKIMKEHGKTIQKMDDTIETYRGKISELQTDIATKSKDYEELNIQGQDWRVWKGWYWWFEKLYTGMGKQVQPKRVWSFSRQVYARL